MPLPELTLQARFIFPVDGPPIEYGCVRVVGERISYVGTPDRAADIDFGNAAIVPGFVNAHTHLELSGLRAKDVAASDFTGWLKRVIAVRRGQNAASISHAIQRGIDASLAAGTTLLGDISTGGRSWKVLQRSPLRAVVFCELIGLKSHRAIESVSAARTFVGWVEPSTDMPPLPDATDIVPETTFDLVLGDGTILEPLPHSSTSRSNRRLSPSLSPHAPYSTHPCLYDLAARWGRGAATPLCSHLAETPEELRLLQHGDGPLRDFLQSIGAWESAWIPAATDAVAYLDGPLTSHADWLIAHGNYFTADDIQQLAERARQDSVRRSIAYCPRTHSYFGHSGHPYSQMLAAGLTVCLGTDSLASTPSLSILDEMRFLRQRDQSLPGESILQMATQAGAAALGRESECGSLTPGKFADLVVVRLPDREDRDPHRLLLKSHEPVCRTMIGGRVVFEMR